MAIKNYKSSIFEKYKKPGGGIPASDMSSAVQASLEKADSALQTETDPVFSASAASGITSGDISSWNAKQDALPSVTNDKYLHTNASTGSLEWVEVPPGVRINRIYIDTQPTKTVYNALEVFDPTGMVVKGDYDNGARVIIEGITITGYTYDTSPMSYGTTSVTISYTESGVTKTVSVTVTVNKNNVTIPTVNGSYTYNGNPQTVSWNSFDAAKMTKTGVETATNAGSNTVTFSLIDSTNYQWEGGTTSDKSVTWTINKAQGSVTPASASITLNASNPSATVALTIVGDGTLSASSSNTSIATVSLSGSSALINSVNQTSGSATISIVQAETSNYLGSTASISVTCSFLELVDWATGTDAQILAMINADRSGQINLRDYWSVGDTRTVSLSAMAATGVGESHAAQSVELVLMDNVCTGFTWSTTPASGVTVPRFIVGMKNSLNETGYMNSANDNTGGWQSCARRTWCNSVFKPSLPSTLVDIFKEFSWRQGVGGGASSGLNTTTDYFGLTPAQAVFGSTTHYAFTDEDACYSQWQWYQTASNRIKNVNGSASFWWECSPYSGYGDCFCFVGSDGSAGASGASATYGLAVFGCI